jgi:hypothetical protein
MNKEIEIIFYYDTIDEATFKPKCRVYFMHEKKLFYSELAMNATTLKESGHYTISTYLDESYDDLLNDIIIDDKTAVTIEDVEIISDSNPEYIAIKNQLKGILRKQKIEKLLN